MGLCARFVCQKCHLKLQLNLRQPDCGFLGYVLQKYCPKRDRIVSVGFGWAGNGYKIGCQDRDFDRYECEDNPFCENCKGECLEELKIAKASKDGTVRWYRCPRHGCGGTMVLNEIPMCWD